MATQKGIIKIEGTVGDITFYKREGQSLVREKGGVSAERIQNDPNYARTRENNREFKNAAQASKVFRDSCRTLIEKAKDSKVVGRLTGKMVEILKTDSTDQRGERVVSKGDLELLTGFEFNLKGLLSANLFAPISMSVDQGSGDIGLDLSVTPVNDLSPLPGATHFVISFGAVYGQLESTQETQFVVENGSYQRIDDRSVSLNYTLRLGGAISKPVFLLILLNFYQDVNGSFYRLNSETHDCLKIVQVVV